MIAALIALTCLNAVLVCALVLRDSLALSLVKDIQARQEQKDIRHERQIQTLLQRIQAPDVAVIQHAQDTPTADPALPLDDQEAAEAADPALADMNLALAEMARRENELHGLVAN